MTDAYHVDGMSCQGCAASVSNAIRAKAPAAAVTVDLDTGVVAVDGADEAVVRTAVADAGFEFRGPVTA